MKKTLLTVSIICSTLLTSCGMLGPSAGTQTGTQTTNGNALGAILNAAGGAQGATSLLGSILGAFTNTTNQNTIIGTWTYQQPSIQFESSNLLAQAGGAMASQSIVNKISPYYEKVGIKPGVAKITLNQNKTCAITLSNRTINGTYVYDSTTGTITVNGTTGIKLFTAYVSVSLNQLSLTLDTSNLLSLVKNAASKSSNSTVSTLSSLSSSFNGMKTGFLFTK